MDNHHQEEGFIKKYIFSVDHKVIGIQYGITSLFFLLFGFCLMLIMRWQLAYPDTPIPIVGFLFNNGILSEGIFASISNFSLLTISNTGSPVLT